jgi:hypothetical protein
MVRDNQIEVYRNIVEPTLQPREQEVLDVIKLFPKGITIYEVADYMRVKANTISGRFGPLENAGKIKSIGKKLIGDSTRKHHIWVALPDVKIDKLGQIQMPF